MAKNEITHKAKIIEITPEYTTVEIISESACAACHARSMCSMSDQKTKVFSLPTDPYTLREVGDEVEVATKRSMGMKAVWISYVIPLLILMILILSLSPVIGNEVITGGAAIGAVAVYYFIIWLLRDKLQKEFVFYIK